MLGDARLRGAHGSDPACDSLVPVAREGAECGANDLSVLSSVGCCEVPSIKELKIDGNEGELPLAEAQLRRVLEAETNEAGTLRKALSRFTTQHQQLPRPGPSLESRRPKLARHGPLPATLRARQIAFGVQKVLQQIIEGRRV